MQSQYPTWNLELLRMEMAQYIQRWLWRVVCTILELEARHQLFQIFMACLSHRHGVWSTCFLMRYNTIVHLLLCKYLCPIPMTTELWFDLAERWANCLTAFGLMNNHLDALDGWLPRTEMPWDVSNQTDYFSGHYQCYGLNVQAMCGPDLEFLYVAVVAPGRTVDA